MRFCLMVLASDQLSSANSVLTVIVRNHKPYLYRPLLQLPNDTVLPFLKIHYNGQLDFLISPTAFVDDDGAQLFYSAHETGQSQLPAWISFISQRG